MAWWVIFEKAFFQSFFAWSLVVHYLTLKLFPRKGSNIVCTVRTPIARSSSFSDSHFVLNVITACAFRLKIVTTCRAKTNAFLKISQRSSRFNFSFCLLQDGIDNEEYSSFKSHDREIQWKVNGSWTIAHSFSLWSLQGILLGNLREFQMHIWVLMNVNDEGVSTVFHSTWPLTAV